jgi:hypothetical protein
VTVKLEEDLALLEKPCCCLKNTVSTFYLFFIFLKGMETAGTPENEQQRALQRQQMNRSSFYMLLFLFSLLFFNFSDDSTVRTGKPTKADLLDDLQKEKEMLNNLTFGVNITHVILLIAE